VGGGGQKLNEKIGSWSFMVAGARRIKAYNRNCSYKVINTLTATLYNG